MPSIKHYTEYQDILGFLRPARLAARVSEAKSCLDFFDPRGLPRGYHLGLSIINLNLSYFYSIIQI